MSVNAPFSWQNRSVLLTGHTGFKGGWLALWLRELGAVVHGYALDPSTQPSLFDVAGVASVLASDTRADLADLDRLELAFKSAQPQVVFHLAAQPLVRVSYADPLATLRTNVLGTAHVLDAARRSSSVSAVVIVTTDKVYENREWTYPYRESDPLGGHDPYSSSKAAAEIVAASFRSSFFGTPGHRARIATARAGNVIGGGDWAADRLVPDCLSAFARKEPVHLRAPQSVRPWQHVLEPLSGYLTLAEHLLGADGQRYAAAWNFGPGAAADATVGEVAGTLASYWSEGAQVVEDRSLDHPHEASQLRLDSTRARIELGFEPRWSLQKALQETISWHQAWMGGSDMKALTLGQIRAYAATGPL